MDFSTINKLNKMQVSSLPESEIPKLLWIMASGEENKSTLTFSQHSHNFFELHALLSGELTYKIGELIESVKEGEFMIISPRLSHSVESSSESFLKLTLAFSLSEGSELFQGFCAHSSHSFKMSDTMREIFDFLLKCADGRASACKNALKMRLTEAIFHAADEMNISLDERNRSDGDPRLYRAKKYVEDNPEIFFSCEEISALCHISSKQLSRIFKSTLGIGLVDYIHKEKLEASKKLLLTTKLREGEIASRLGFSSVQYFSKFFLKYTKENPTEYRRKNL